MIVGPLAYAVLVLVLRVSGKRMPAKLNAFDLVVTALGSTLATALLSKSVALAEGMLAFAILAGMQFVVAWLSARSSRFGDFVKSDGTFSIIKDEPRIGSMTSTTSVAAA